MPPNKRSKSVKKRKRESVDSEKHGAEKQIAEKQIAEQQVVPHQSTDTTSSARPYEAPDESGSGAHTALPHLQARRYEALNESGSDFHTTLPQLLARPEVTPRDMISTNAYSGVHFASSDRLSTASSERDYINLLMELQHEADARQAQYNRVPYKNPLQSALEDNPSQFSPLARAHLMPLDVGSYVSRMASSINQTAPLVSPYVQPQPAMTAAQQTEEATQVDSAVEREEDAEIASAATSNTSRYASGMAPSKKQNISVESSTTETHPAMTAALPTQDATTLDTPLKRQQTAIENARAQIAAMTGASPKQETPLLDIQLKRQEAAINHARARIAAMSVAPPTQEASILDTPLKRQEAAISNARAQMALKGQTQTHSVTTAAPPTQEAPVLDSPLKRQKAAINNAEAQMVLEDQTQTQTHSATTAAPPTQEAPRIENPLERQEAAINNAKTQIALKRQEDAINSAKAQLPLKRQEDAVKNAKILLANNTTGTTATVQAAPFGNTPPTGPRATIPPQQLLPWYDEKAGTTLLPPPLAFSTHPLSPLNRKPSLDLPAELSAVHPLPALPLNNHGAPYDRDHPPANLPSTSQPDLTLPPQATDSDAENVARQKTAKLPVFEPGAEEFHHQGFQGGL
ncbi:MAG: hypothetical protein Q9181_001314 [Wetmoreana brouardii]